jgi:uncharacterized protein YkwD
VREGKFQ